MPEKDKSFIAIHRDGWLIPLNPADLAHLQEGQEILIEITRFENKPTTDMNNDKGRTAAPEESSE